MHDHLVQSRQARQQPLPAYTLEAGSGEEHARSFRVRCELPGRPDVSAEGSGGSRRAAEQVAAEAVLGMLEKSS